MTTLTTHQTPTERLQERLQRSRSTLQDAMSTLQVDIAVLAASNESMLRASARASIQLQSSRERARLHLPSWASIQLQRYHWDAPVHP